MVDIAFDAVRFKHMALFYFKRMLSCVEYNRVHVSYNFLKLFKISLNCITV